MNKISCISNSSITLLLLQETIATADGDHTVTIKTKIFGEEESLELEEISNSAFIYHQGKSFYYT